MWFWIGLGLLLLWGAWGYWRRRWWLREINRTLGEAQRAIGSAGGDVLHYEPPPRLVVPDRVLTALAGAAAIIGLFLVIGSRWGWFA